VLIGLERLAPVVPFKKLKLMNAIVVLEASHKPGVVTARRRVYLSAYLILINIGNGCAWCMSRIRHLQLYIRKMEPGERVTMSRYVGTTSIESSATSVSLFYDLLNPPSLVLLLCHNCEDYWSAALVTPTAGQLKI
jgi:hypothetical protein